MTRLLLQLARNRCNPSSKRRPSVDRLSASWWAIPIELSNKNKDFFGCVLNVLSLNIGMLPWWITVAGATFHFDFHHLSWNQATICFPNKWYLFNGKMFSGHLCSFYSWHFYWVIWSHCDWRLGGARVSKGGPEGVWLSEVIEILFAGIKGCLAR